MLKKVFKISVIVIVVIVIIVVLFLLLWKPFGQGAFYVNQSDYASRTPYYKNGVFETIESFVLLSDEESQFGSNEQTVPDVEIPVHELKKIEDTSIEELKITWFGHSASLLQIHGMNVFLDPMLSDYSSPVQGIGPKRMAKLPIEIENLPQIDILMLSHDHYDHMDYNTIINIDDKVSSYVVPLGVENHLIRWGIDESKIHVMAWWDEIEIQGMKIASTPGQHYSGRLPWQQNTTLWSGYVLSDEYHQVYYTGDTGYGEFFKDIHERYGAMDLVIMENGQYDNQWPDCHMMPDEGVQAAQILEAKWVIPVHWAGFSLSYHSWDTPIEQYIKIADENEVKVATPMIGEVVDYKQIESYQQKWWQDVK